MSEPLSDKLSKLFQAARDAGVATINEGVATFHCGWEWIRDEVYKLYEDNPWRPIAEAPRTGPLLLGRKGMSAQGYWSIHNNCWCDAGGHPFMDQPTHYRLMPDPPS